jgi:hypothetical protein
MFDINKVLIKKNVKYLVDVEFISIVSLFLHCLSIFARQRVSANYSIPAQFRIYPPSPMSS